MKTLSYPNYSENMPIGKIYNLNKWMGAMKDIYIKLHLGASRNESVEQITNDWDMVEKREFLDWLKYYESGDHLKYKRAQNSYYVNDDINYFLPNPKANIPNPIRSINDQISSIPQEAAQIVSNKQNELSKEDKRKIIEDLRKKILGRLNSAERLLSSQQGQIFAGPDFEKLLSAIYELKKQIQTVNKISLSAQTIIDLVIRQANILKSQGYNNASEFMVKFAQNTPGDFSMNLGDTPAGGSQPQGGGSLGNPAPDLTQPPGGPEANAKGGVAGFLDNIGSDNLTEDKNLKDKNVVEDKNEDEKDEVIIDDDVADPDLLDQEIFPEDEENELVVHAQAIPDVSQQRPVDENTQTQVPAEAPAEAQAAPSENLEVESPAVNPTGITPEEASAGPNVQVKNDFDALIDSAFSNLTVEDVVKKLEDVNKIFRNREISRQLAIVDVMLDHLGLAPYFPSLAEATNKQLEANQYCLTRIDDVLSKLRGTVQTSKINLSNENQKISPEAEGVRSTLEQEEQKENKRKEIKKQVQDQADLEKVKPEAGVEGAPQELAAQPAQIEQAPFPARQ
jgi:hypothetical protein